jgi:hypothetical protein
MATRSAGVVAMTLVAVGSFTLLQSPERVVASNATPIGFYTSFAQTLPNFGTYSLNATSEGIAADFAQQVLHENLDVERIHSASNSITDVMALNSVDGRTLGWIAITNYSHDPRTLDEPVQHPFIVGVSDNTSPDGYLDYNLDFIQSASLYAVQQASAYEILAPLWNDCDSITVSLTTWSEGIAQELVSTQARANETVTLPFVVSNPTAAFAIATCRDSSGRLQHFEAKPVGLIPNSTVPKNVMFTGTNGVTSTVSNDSADYYSGGSAELFARTWTGEIQMADYKFSAKFVAGKGMPSPQARCEQLLKTIPESQLATGLSKKFVCGVKDGEGTMYAFIEVRPGAVLLVNESFAGAQNFGVANFNRLAENLKITITD